MREQNNLERTHYNVAFTLPRYRHYADHFRCVLFAGIIKGFLGIGLPPAAMVILTLVIETPLAISLLTLPIIFTNLFQYLGWKIASK